MRRALPWAFASSLLALAVTGCSGEPAQTVGNDTELDTPHCVPLAPTCDATLPDLGEARGFRHTSSKLTAALGSPTHRGRDMFYNPGDDIWVMGKLAYGLSDKDLEDEEVDIYLERDCGDAWEYVDTVLTTDDGDHETVEGVADTGGRVYFEVPKELDLGLGRHRFELVVAGDLTHVPVYVDIVPPRTPIIVSDVDGTLTSSESAEFGALLTGTLPKANPGAAEVLTALADQGYRIMYVTARAEGLMTRTREFLDERGFPPGLVHTSLTPLGLTGDAAAKYKTGELAMLASHGLVPEWGFGNRDSDAQTYTSSDVEGDHCILYQWDDPGLGCRRVDDYTSLLPEIEDAGAACIPAD
ncbi:MAG TPA: phosphatidylinositol transfer protein [Polyangiaceae bacterium]|nr:phosphatidylinositol transfer protein [Polyangiaceae bacterium]